MKNLFVYLFIALTFFQCRAERVDVSPNKPLTRAEIITGSENLYGLVEDEHANPLKGVVVSDGFSCVTTDSAGIYRLQRDSAATFVFLSIPAEYNVGIGQDGLREFYRKINVAPTEKMRADFKLTKKNKETKFKIIGIGDPQVANSTELARFQNETIKDIRAHFKDEVLPYYGLVLGDVVADKKELLQPIKDLLATICPSVFAVAGNHDHFSSATNPVRNGETFSAVYGPLNYSFNVGDVHFICLDDIIFAPDNSYSSGFSAEQLEWIKQDLSYVSKDKMLVVSYHRHTLNTNGQEFKNLLKGYHEVHIMAGHTHSNINSITTASPLNYMHVHGAACGRWWSSTINADGTPNGYKVFEVENNTMKNWYYKSVNYSKDFQIRLYKGNSEFGGTNGTFGFGFTSSEIVANVWNADKTWKIDVYEDNVKTGSMASFNGIDAWATGYHNGVLKEKAFANTDHLYKYTLKNPDAAIKVVATDRFGNVYSETKFTTDLSSASSY